MSALPQCKRALAIANRILAREGVVDAYGHVSLRHPDDPGRFLLSCSRSPGLVIPADIMEFGLDGEVAKRADKRQPYLERYIHAAIYESRPDVRAVVHNHSPAIVPFSVSRKQKLRPLLHVAGAMGLRIPVWDIRTRFGDTNLLVANLAQGRDMARTMSKHAVVLMRGHGCSIAAETLKEVVITAVNMQLNATLQLDALRLGGVIYLSPGEVEKTREISRTPSVTDRVWQYLASRADCTGI